MVPTANRHAGVYQPVGQEQMQRSEPNKCVVSFERSGFRGGLKLCHEIGNFNTLVDMGGLYNFVVMAPELCGTACLFVFVLDPRDKAASIFYRSLVVGAAINTANKPGYAFNTSQLALRRYFGSGQNITHGSMVDLTVPYFAVDLNWIDATSDNRTSKAGWAEFTDVNIWFSIRVDGSTAILRDQPWNASTAFAYASSQAHVFTGKKLVSVKVTTLEANATLADGTRITNETKCPTVSDLFGRLPDVTQHQRGFMTSGEEFAGYDCYLFAEATITAGKYSAKGCNVTSEISKPYADCSIERDDDGVREDWLTLLSLDFMSEVLKYSIMLNYTQPWLSNSLDDYTTGMLTVGYHAAWSGLMAKLGNITESANLWMAEDIVSVSIGHEKIFIWLGMNLTLSVAAILAFVAQRCSRMKTTNDTTLAPLLMNLTEIAHSDRATGLCSVVDLRKEDHKLPRLMWKGQGGNTGSRGDVRSAPCNRRVGFVSDNADGTRSL
ncbi:hypothetical protein G7Z17_g2371 [Cylindrodendrum hubeiense]|uniref:Uncharacterized protein n=1 Tax=Cylindrodendrum hubeiense TaxID=595255 RepID=A0A9P5LBQ2_9HYPO|nr:hypothetical protein G7Z17_g2371 [Cylindrodendrum hubeiense]